MGRLRNTARRKQEFNIKTAADAAGSNTDDIPDETVAALVAISS